MRPRIRSIKPEFFTNNLKMQTIGVGSRYVAIGLISMADDRGRVHLMLPAVRGYIFPNGDISEKQFEKALADLEGAGVKFIWRYVVEPFTYLWIPSFWRHQRINRPSESPLPPHPRDPYRDLPVIEALAQYIEDVKAGHDPLSDESLNQSVNDSRNGSLNGSVTHAGARARTRNPDPDPEVVRLCEHLSGRVRANEPKAKTHPQSERWTTDMRLLLAERDGDAREVERVIDWCQTDEFWRTNILSPGSLRKQFTRLLLQSQKGNVVPLRNSKPSPSDLLRQINGGNAA